MKLERYRGHFYNWYDARTLKAEPPFFVSSVDSGNLACSLLTTSQACMQMASEPLFSPRLWLGIKDRLRLLRADCRGGWCEAAARGNHLRSRTAPAIFRKIRSTGFANCTRSKRSARKLERAIQSIGHKSPDLAYWSRDLLCEIRELRHLAATFAPWLVGEKKDFIEKLAIRPQVDIRPTDAR